MAKSFFFLKIKFLNYLDTTPEKLFDGIYRTHDEDHIWKCDKNNNQTIELRLEFVECYQIGLIRIYNYNKSRIYSYRGVKDLIIYLDEVKIFDGIIEIANGELKGNLNKFGDVSSFLLLEEKDLIKYFFFIYNNSLSHFRQFYTQLMKIISNKYGKMINHFKNHYQ